MKRSENKESGYRFSYTSNNNDVPLDVEEIANTFKCENTNRLRPPQKGALCAIQSNWTLSDDPLTVVLPTGTGKTETMLATIISEKITRTLILVPSKLLRNQTFDRAKSWGILKEINCIGGDVINPNVLMLTANAIERDVFEHRVHEANIIISTGALLGRMDTNRLDYLVKACNLLVLDEAHHLPSVIWSKIRERFKDKKILQFTATPYRQDGKRVDGKIVYNYPMRNAMEAGYFAPMQFVGVEEYDEKRSDLCIANRAIEVLKRDLKAGYEHVLLVRAKTIKRAKALYDEIYSQYTEYSPLLITSQEKTTEKKEGLSALREGLSKIVVCVDMFGEGIDIPNLKILALHDKYKSLPITLQFVGRLAREKEGLGEASIIANVADEGMMGELEQLYKRDADWKKMLPITADSCTEEQIQLQELIDGFRADSADIDISQIKLKVSMWAYTYKNTLSWDPYGWTKGFDSRACRAFINETEKILILIEPVDSLQSWTSQENIKSLNWYVYVVYWNPEKRYVCVNATEFYKAERLLHYVFGEELERIRSEVVFRATTGIKELSLATVGLNSAIDGPIRYQMYAGVDLEKGITESTKSQCFKSNLFGVGYEHGGKTSIGCSYRGKVWSKWVESIGFWKNWCDHAMKKILDDNNDTKILTNVIVPETIKSLPKNDPAYRIDFPSELLSKQKITIECNAVSYNILDCELRIGEFKEDKQYFKLVCDRSEYLYSYSIDDKGTTIIYEEVDEPEPSIIRGRRAPVKLSEFFKNNNPVIWYVSGKRVEGSTLVDLRKNNEAPRNLFLEKNIIVWDWKELGVDIRKESQLGNQGEIIKDSIQYGTIQMLIKDDSYSVIFDDDGSGEIADIVAIKEEDKRIIVELYHCKYSSADKPGARVGDLYVVCGQAEKSIRWSERHGDLMSQMKHRETMRKNKCGISRFAKGNLSVLNTIKRKMRRYRVEYRMYIVQPGVDHRKIVENMNDILANTCHNCMVRGGIPFKIICS